MVHPAMIASRSTARVAAAAMMSNPAIIATFIHPRKPHRARPFRQRVNTAGQRAIADGSG